MMSVRRVSALFVVSTAAAAFAAGCHKTIPQQAAVPPPPPASTVPAVPVRPPAPPAARPAPAPAPAPRSVNDEDVFAAKSLDELNAEHPLADVFFDLDKAEIREDGKPPLQRDAEWLKRFAMTQVTVEGHCDSRGSSEYNLALGSRRAEAIKSYLVSLGVPDARITVVSKGKEQPFCEEENESCWQQNRRGHFLITAK
jgi:peptidoglycan-associated lipoprotein